MPLYCQSSYIMGRGFQLGLGTGSGVLSSSSHTPAGIRTSRTPGVLSVSSMTVSNERSSISATRSFPAQVHRYMLSSRPCLTLSDVYINLLVALFSSQATSRLSLPSTDSPPRLTSSSSPCPLLLRLTTSTSPARSRSTTTTFATSLRGMPASVHRCTYHSPFHQVPGRD